jgi:GT2 family glycosyltransferase
MDTVVDPDWLTRLVEAADKQPDLHILQSKLLVYGTDQVNSLGNRIHYLGYGYCNGYGSQPASPPKAVRMDYASGAAMLVKREVFETIGLFREDYFMYYEDMEFCWRARLAGYNVGLADASICHHRYSAQNAFRFLYYSQRNRLLTCFTLEKPGTLLLTLPCLILAECVVSVYFVIRGWGRTQWDVCRYFFNTATWTTILATRREVKRLRRRNDADIVRAFAGQVHSAYIHHWFLRYVCNPLLWLYWAVVRTLIVW